MIRNLSSEPKKRRLISIASPSANRSFVLNYLFPNPSISIVRQGSADLRYYVFLPDGSLLYSVEATSGVCHHRLPHAGGESVDGQWKMLTARAATSRMVTEEMADSLSMSSFAQRVRGMASVGLNAIEFVKETYM